MTTKSESAHRSAMSDEDGLSERYAMANIIDGNLHVTNEFLRHGFSVDEIARLPKQVREEIGRGAYLVRGNGYDDENFYIVYRRKYILDRTEKRDFVKIYNRRGRLVYSSRGKRAIADNNIIDREGDRYIHGLIYSKIGDEDPRDG
jgi:hypothetical protein